MRDEIKNEDLVFELLIIIEQLFLASRISNAAVTGLLLRQGLDLETPLMLPPPLDVLSGSTPQNVFEYWNRLWEDYKAYCADPDMNLDEMCLESIPEFQEHINKGKRLH